jgi:hypothetical protein
LAVWRSDANVTFFVKYSKTISFLLLIRKIKASLSGENVPFKALKEYFSKGNIPTRKKIGGR